MQAQDTAYCWPDDWFSCHTRPEYMHGETVPSLACCGGLLGCALLYWPVDFAAKIQCHWRWIWSRSLDVGSDDVLLLPTNFISRAQQLGGRTARLCTWTRTLPMMIDRLCTCAVPSASRKRQHPIPRWASNICEVYYKQNELGQHARAEERGDVYLQ